MSHQYNEGWFPECIVCGCGNFAPIVCLSCFGFQSVETKIAQTMIDNTESETVEHLGHHYKHCYFCQSRQTSQPGDWGSLAVCGSCFNSRTQEQFDAVAVLVPFTKTRRDLSSIRIL